MSAASRALSVRSDRVARRFVARYGASVAYDRSMALRVRSLRSVLVDTDFVWLVIYSYDLKRHALGSIWGLK